MTRYTKFNKEMLWEACKLKFPTRGNNQCLKSSEWLSQITPQWPKC